MDLEVCVECIHLLANGEVSDGDGMDITAAHAAKVDALWGSIEIVPSGHEDEEGSFSWRTCEGCGSPLGGDRFAAHAFTA